MAITHAPVTVPISGERVSDISDALVPAGLYCVPAQVDSGQVLDIAKLYIQNHAPKLIVDALVEKFPCN